MQTAQPEQTADLPEKVTKRSELSPQLESPLETCEGEVKMETGSERDASKDVSKDGVTPCNEKLRAKETSSESISSELLNADSPRTSMDSGVLVPLDNIGTYPHCISAEMVDSNIIHMSDHLGDQLLSLHGCHRISVKLEDGSFQDDSCNYMLAQLDEERGLPWWDWP